MEWFPLVPVEDAYYSGDTLEELQLTYYSHIDPDETVEIVNTLRERAADGQTIFYDIYTDEEKDGALITSSIFVLRVKGSALFCTDSFTSLSTAPELHPVKSSMAHRTIAMYETGFIGSTTICFLSSL